MAYSVRKYAMRALAVCTALLLQPQTAAGGRANGRTSALHDAAAGQGWSVAHALMKHKRHKKKIRGRLMAGKQHSNAASSVKVNVDKSQDTTLNIYKGSVMQELRVPPNPTLVQTNQEPIDAEYTKIPGKGYYQALLLCHSKGEVPHPCCVYAWV